MNASHILCILTALVMSAATAAQSPPPFHRFGGEGPAIWGTASRAHLGDLDGDGAPDLVFGAQQGIEVSINDGAGVFGPAHWYQFSQFPLGTGGSPVCRDLDGDGDLDIVCLLRTSPIGSQPFPVVSLMNDGRGNFTEDWTRFPSNLRPEADLGVFFDADGDGDEDLALFGWNDPILVTDDGTGRFTEVPGAFPANTTIVTTNRAFAGDFDGDGDLDLMVANRAGIQEDVLYLNDGAGRFSVGWTFPTIETFGLDCADFDGDGDLDVLLGTTGTTRSLWINDGNARFTDASTRLGSPTPLWTTRLEAWFRDLDGDGDLDIVIDDGRYGIEVFLNDGTGHFTDVSAAMPWAGYRTRNVYVEDYDRDGDLDLSLEIPYRRGAVFHNLHRHVHAPDPVIGQPWTIDLWSRPGYDVTYAVGFVRRDLHLPPFGWWALDPTFAVAFPGTLHVPASGTVSSTLPIPNFPALRNHEVFVQALELDFNTPASLRSTNFDRSTIR